MENRFEFAYEDESERSRISFDYSLEGDELIRFGQTDSEYYLTANRAGFLSLAKLCIKLAQGSYKEGFHIHLGEDFAGSDSAKTLLIGVIRPEAGA